MTILAFYATIRTLPSPPIKFVLNSIQKEFASNNSVLRHVVCALSWILVKIYLLRLFNRTGTFLPLSSLLGCKQLFEKERSLVLRFLLFLFFELPIFNCFSAAFFITVLHLIFNTLYITTQKKIKKIRKLIEFIFQIWPKYSSILL